MLFAIATLLLTQQSSTLVFVRAQVVQTCVLTQEGARCSGALASPPTVSHEAGRTVFSF